MIIDFSEYLGEVKNDTGIWGKGFIFKVITNKNNESYTFDIILFIHPTLQSFISTAPEDDIFDKDTIIEHIFDKYTKEQLMEVTHDN